MSVKKRFKEFIKSQGFTISSFEKDINVSNGYVNSISKGIGGEILISILEKSPNLNINWLLTGQGSMLKEPAQPVALSSQSQENDKYTALLEKNIAIMEAQLKDKDKILALQEEKIADLEEKLKFAEFRDKKDMDFKIKAQRKEKKAKDEIILAQTNTINLQNKEINALKSRHLPPDEPLQPTKGL